MPNEIRYFGILALSAVQSGTEIPNIISAPIPKPNGYHSAAVKENLNKGPDTDLQERGPPGQERQRGGAAGARLSGGLRQQPRAILKVRGEKRLAERGEPQPEPPGDLLEA